MRFLMAMHAYLTEVLFYPDPARRAREGGLSSELG